MTRPRRVVVVGAGIVGLSTAWFLQEHDIEVAVVDRQGVAAGASWGNAGWIAPPAPCRLTEPSALRDGLLAMVQPACAVLRRLALGRTSHLALPHSVRRPLHPAPVGPRRLALAGLNAHASGAYDRLSRAGVSGTVTQKPLIAAFTQARHASHLHDAGDLEPFGLAKHGDWSRSSAQRSDTSCGSTASPTYSQHGSWRRWRRRSPSVAGPSSTPCRPARPCRTCVDRLGAHPRRRGRPRHRGRHRPARARVRRTGSRLRWAWLTRSWSRRLTPEYPVSSRTSACPP